MNEVHPADEPYDTPVGRFVRLRVWAVDRNEAIRDARTKAGDRGWSVQDVVSVAQMPFDPDAVGRGERTGGAVVEVRIG